MNDLSKKIVNDAVELAKVNAINVLKRLKFDDIQSLVEAEMASLWKTKLKPQALIGLRSVTVSISPY